MAYLAFTLTLLAGTFGKSWNLIFIAASCISANNLGTRVPISDRPSLAQVEVALGTVWIQQCAGAVLTNFHILSVATCFSGAFYRPDTRRIRLGSDIRNEGGLIVNVLLANNHHSFDPTNMASDISVVRLSSAVTLGGNIQQASVILQGVYVPPRLSVELIGWGNTPQGGAVTDDNLYGLSLTTVDRYTCRSKYEDREVTNTMLCFGLPREGGRDFFTRDVGAPVFYQNALISLISFGESDANNEYPLVGTGISDYTNWIIENAAS
ncbi:trypsin CFT-1-like [Bombyx mandarina]|uniref:Trypsin CFT-1-like n=1 Tax=Bombyx mandarina TaxID=7092 RepID=A0A6J2KC60_BOMMA|nr:trypsin CFT-1-like [Bombyx mandarina]